MKPFTYAVIVNWYNYEPSISLFHTKKEAELDYKRAVKISPKDSEPFLAKIIKGNPTPYGGN